MKKITGLVIAASIVLGTVVIAQELLKVKGTVTNIDTAAMSVTIKPENGDVVTIIMKDAESLSKVGVGETAEARYMIKDGKNIGTRIRIIKEGCSQ